MYCLFFLLHINIRLPGYDRIYKDYLFDVDRFPSFVWQLNEYIVWNVF